MEESIGSNIKTFYFIRHAESTANRAKRSGVTVLDASFADAPITDHGIFQAEETARITSSLPVEIVICSPLRRTIETALHVFPGKQMYLESRAREICWEHIECRAFSHTSPWQKSTVKGTIGKIAKRFPHASISIDESSIAHLDEEKDVFWQPQDEAIMSKENIRILATKAKDELLSALFARKETSIGVVSHYATMNELFDISPNNCSVYKIVVCRTGASSSSSETFYISQINCLHS